MPLVWGGGGCYRSCRASIEKLSLQPLLFDESDYSANESVRPYVQYLAFTVRNAPYTAATDLIFKSVILISRKDDHDDFDAELEFTLALAPRLAKPDCSPFPSLCKINPSFHRTSTRIYAQNIPIS
jgi:hypothetical protein